MPTNKIAPKKGVYNPPHASLQKGPGNEVGVQSLSKVVGTPMVSRYICLFTIIPSKNLIGGEGGGRRFYNILVKILMCPNTFESDCKYRTIPCQ